MRVRWVFRALLLACAVTLTSESVVNAGPVQVGYFTDFNAGSTGWAGPITLNGDIPNQITNIATANFANFFKVLINESNNGSPSAALLGRTAALASYVQGGGILGVNSRNVNQGPTTDNQWLPGGAGITFHTNFSSNIDVLTAGTLLTNGPFGTINNTTLDGGNFSNHGWADISSLPAGAVTILDDGNSTHAVAFYYGFGNGFVFFSSSPLDFYFNGYGNNPPRDNFNNIYAPNLIALLDSLAVVPEPTSLAIFGLLGLCGAGAYFRRRKVVV